MQRSRRDSTALSRWLTSTSHRRTDHPRGRQPRETARDQQVARVSGAVAGLAARSLWNRRGTALLTVIAIAVSVTLLLGVQKMRDAARESFANTLSGTDLIVGARSGPVNLLLYSVFRIGDATANVSWSTYQRVARHRDVAWTIPLSLGDAHRGYRVLGTTAAYFDHYRYGRTRPLEFTHGGPFADLRDAVLGAEVARALEYG